MTAVSRGISAGLVVLITIIASGPTTSAFEETSLGGAAIAWSGEGFENPER